MAHPSLRSEYLSPVDAAWMHMDEPTNMAMIVGVMMFDEELDFARYRKLVEERLLVVPRFRQRVREPRLGIGLPRWEPDPHFDLDSHLHRIALPAPHDQSALHDLVGDLMSTPLDYTKPLWQYTFVENYGRGSALIGRLHHAMGDGMALIQVLLSMADKPRRSRTHASALEEVAPHNGKHNGHFAPVRQTRELIRSANDFVTHREKWAKAALAGVSGSVALGKLLLIGPDQPTLFKGECGVIKRAAWTKPIPLPEVKFVARAFGATVNDVLVSSVTGALGRYLERQGTDPQGMNIRALVPVNLRAPGDLDLEHLGNRFGLVFLELPIGVRDPQARMRILKERMDYIKVTPEAMIAYGILNVIGTAPVMVEHVINSIFGAKGTAVMTNVPGPRETMYLAGSPVRGLMFWVPTPAHLGLGVSIISYAGQVIVGVGTDAGLVPDPDAIVEAVCDEFKALKQRALELNTIHIEVAPVTSLPEPVSPGHARAARANGKARSTHAARHGRAPIHSKSANL